MSDLPSPDAALVELRALVAGLRAANAGLREVIEARDAQLEAKDAQVAVLTRQVEALAARVEELEHRQGRGSSTSSRPPSSDSPYEKKPTDRSLRRRSGRRPGKQPGAESATLRQAADPDETLVCAPAACARCGAGLDGADLTGMQKLQVFDITPPPPRVTEYQVQSRRCVRCGAVSAGQPPAHVSGQACYGSQVHAQAAHLTCAHHIPIHRCAGLLAALAGVPVPAGFVAGVRAKAAGKLEPFMQRVRRDPRPRRRAPGITCTWPAPGT